MSHQIMTQEQIAELRRDIDQWKPTNDLALKLIDKLIGAIEAAQQEIADLKRGGVVVPDDEFTLDLDTQKGSDPCITINSKKNGVGYELVRGSIDGHFSRRTYNITPYMRPFLETVGIRTIPADRVLREGDRVVGREEWMYLAALERYARKHGPESIQDVIECLDHLRSQLAQEPTP